MKIMVGYNGGEAGKKALTIARDYAVANKAVVYVITSLEGGKSETISDIETAEAGLAFARSVIETSGVECVPVQSVQGLSPGEDLVRFSREKDIDHIFLGIKKISKAKKILLGSTASYVILKASCPVTTTK